MWVEVARVVRGQIIGVKQLQYVTAARALGFTDFRIITKHILPNIMAPIIVICAANFAAAILIESGLSFLGYWCTTANGKLGCHDKRPLQLYHFREALFSANSRYLYNGFGNGFYANR